MQQLQIIRSSKPNSVAFTIRLSCARNYFFFLLRVFDERMSLVLAVLGHCLCRAKSLCV